MGGHFDVPEAIFERLGGVFSIFYRNWQPNSRRSPISCCAARHKIGRYNCDGSIDMRTHRFRGSSCGQPGYSSEGTVWAPDHHGNSVAARKLLARKNGLLCSRCPPVPSALLAFRSLVSGPCALARSLPSRSPLSVEKSTCGVRRQFFAQLPWKLFAATSGRFV